MPSDKVLRLLGKWHPDIGDLPVPDEENDNQSPERKTYSPGDRKDERIGHVGMKRRPHPGNRR